MYVQRYRYSRHLKEDFKELMPGESMDDEDLESAEVSQFHYFKLHDYDGNNKLDGLELGEARRRNYAVSKHKLGCCSHVTFDGSGVQNSTFVTRNCLVMFVHRTGTSVSK